MSVTIRFRKIYFSVHYLNILNNKIQKTTIYLLFYMVVNLSLSPKEKNITRKVRVYETKITSRIIRSKKTDIARGRRKYAE
jgi:hypothetical protein